MIGIRKVKCPYVPKTPAIAKEMTCFIDWVPTGLDEIELYFGLAPVSVSDVVYDLGSGDGRLVFAALEKGAGKAVGVEIDPELIREARETARINSFNGNIRFLETDFMKVSLADASVVFCYLSPEIYAALKPKFESELKSSARIVTQGWVIPGWKPARAVEKEGSEFYLYIMPPEESEG